MPTAPTHRPPAFAPRPALEPLRLTTRAVNAITFGLRALGRAV